MNNDNRLPHEKMEDELKVLKAQRLAREKVDREKKVATSINKLVTLLQTKCQNPTIIKEALTEILEAIEQCKIQ